MAIKDRNLEVGTLLRGSYRKVAYECRVEADENEALVFVLGDGRRFRSLSAAASAVMDGNAVNGWLFWSAVNTAGPVKVEVGFMNEEPASAKPPRTSCMYSCGDTGWPPTLTTSCVTPTS